MKINNFKIFKTDFEINKKKEFNNLFKKMFQHHSRDHYLGFSTGCVLEVGGFRR